MLRNFTVNHTDPPKKERLVSKNFILVMLAATSTTTMNQFFNSSVALHVTAIGGLQVHAGILLTVFTTAALAVRPVTGILSDKYGRVKLLIVGAFICAACSLLYGISSGMSTLIIVRCFMGLGFGMHSTCAGAVAADVLPKSRLAEGIGIFGLGGTVAQALAPMIAISIIGDGTLTNFRMLFFIAAGLCTLGMVSNCFNSYERIRKKNAVVTKQTNADGITFMDSAKATADAEPLPKTFFGFEYVVFAPVVVMVLLYMGFSSLMLYLTPFARGIGIANPGLYFLVSSAGVFLSRIIFGRITDKYGNDVVIIPGIAVFALLLAVLPFVGSLTVLLALALPIGLVQGAVIPTFNAILFKRCSPARRGTASGAFFSSFDIGFAIGAPLLGALADAQDYRFVFWAAAGFMALAMMLYLLIASDRVYKKKQANKQKV